MAKYLSGIRVIVKQMLRDEFVSGTDEKWEGDELDIYIGQAVAEVSERKPYVVKETLTTTNGSRELSISSITNLLSIDKLEWPTGSYPREYRNFIQIDSNTIEMDTVLTPGDSENVYVYCNKLHTLTEALSTLGLKEEPVVILGAAAMAAIAKSQYYINRVGHGGARKFPNMMTWGMTKLDLYHRSLRRLAPPTTTRRYPKD